MVLNENAQKGFESDWGIDRQTSCMVEKSRAEIN